MPAVLCAICQRMFTVAKPTRHSRRICPLCDGGTSVRKAPRTTRVVEEEAPPIEPGMERSKSEPTPYKPTRQSAGPFLETLLWAAMGLLAFGALYGAIYHPRILWGVTPAILVTIAVMTYLFPENGQGLLLLTKAAVVLGAAGYVLYHWPCVSITLPVLAVGSFFVLRHLTEQGHNVDGPVLAAIGAVLLAGIIYWMSGPSTKKAEPEKVAIDPAEQEYLNNAGGAKALLQWQNPKMSGAAAEEAGRRIADEWEKAKARNGRD